MVREIEEGRLSTAAAALDDARGRIAAVFDEALDLASGLASGPAATSPRLRTRMSRLMAVLQDADLIDQRFDHLVTALRQGCAAGASPAVRRVLAGHVASLAESSEEAGDMLAETLRSAEDAAEVSGMALGRDVLSALRRLGETADRLSAEAASLRPIGKRLSPPDPYDGDTVADLSWLLRLYTTDVERAVHRRAVFTRDRR